MDFPLYFQKSDLTGVGYIFDKHFFLKGPNTPKYVLVWVVACRKLTSEKCPITPANPHPPLQLYVLNLHATMLNNCLTIPK